MATRLYCPQGTTFRRRIFVWQPAPPEDDWDQRMSTAFESTDPVLADGEVGYETDTEKFKVGDGTTAWTGLDYATTSRVHGAAVDLTGYTGRMQVRIDPTATDTVLDLTTENGGVTISPAGYVDLYASDTATAAIDPDTYRYDLELRSAGTPPTGGDVTRIVEGPFVVTVEVTR